MCFLRNLPIALYSRVLPLAIYANTRVFGKIKHYLRRENKAIYEEILLIYIYIFTGTVKWPGRISWWRHQMETFSALLAICAGNSPVPGEFPAQRPVTRSFDVFFDLRLNKRLSKQWWGWWFETPSSPLWRHCNGVKSAGNKSRQT